MAKRGANEGTIYLRQDGRWQGVLNLGYVGGKRRRKSFYAHTRAEVAAKLLAAGRALQLGQAPAPEVLRVGGFLERWLEDTAKLTVRITTYKRYQAALKHIVPGVGSLRLVKLSPDDLDSLYRSLGEQGLSAKYIRLIHAVLHRALRHALRRGLVGSNVADLAQAPAASRTEFRVLSAEEAARFLATTEDDRLGALYVLAIHTGMRQAELLGLRWADVSEGHLSVRQQGCRIDGEWRFMPPKTKAGRRMISLSPTATEALRLHRLRQSEERLAAPSWQDLDLVFPNAKGRPIERENLLRRAYWPALKRAGLPRIRFHDLRHTAATLLLAGGVHAKVVSEMLGHSSVAITLDVYSHVTPSMQADAAEKMDAMLAPAQASS